MIRTHRLFKLGNVKNWMNGRRGWKLQAIRHRTDLGNNAIRSKELEGQLMMGMLSKRRLNIRLELEVDPVIELELPFGAVHISILLHALLGT